MKPQAREEAPAGAWEPAVIKGDGFNSRGGGFATLIVDGVRYTSEQIRDALRAQPQAREDAQPLGCFCDEADCPSCSSINPDPDALRCG